jgi:hypothetical protein
MTQVYNISFQIAPNLQEQWLLWMKSKFIPMVVETACFENQHFYELDVTEDQAPTYTMQLFAQTPENLAKFTESYAAALLDELHKTWGDQCFHFVTTMRIVN